MASTDVDVGHVVAGKYELVRLLGRGSMGEVWAAHHKTLAEQVALKLLTQVDPTDELEDSATAAARFLFEAQVAARLSRKTRHIVRVTDHGEEGGVVYLVMELLEGETLENVMARDGKAPIPTVATIVSQVARALAAAHSEGVFHRDLKPANVFLSQDEDGKSLVKLLDFGIARTTHAHKAAPAYATAKGVVFGTPSYMSPEQARASSKLDHRCDLWALATIAYEAITGELPVNGEDTDELLMNLCAHRIVPLRDRRPDLPEALGNFFTKAFSEKLELRFQSAAELATAFHRALGSVPPPMEEDAASGSGPRKEPSFDLRLPRSRGRAIAVAVGVAVLAFVGVGMAWRALGGSAPSSTPASAAVGEQPTASSPPAVQPPAPLPSTTLADPSPAVPVMSLPRVTGRAPIGQVPERPWSPSPPVVVPAAQPAAATPVSPPTPAPAPAPTPSKKVDKSEVL
jgi:eukaryotic-like serine/threonine-protein kinase